MSYYPFRLLSVFVVALVFALSLPFGSDAHGQDGEAEKNYIRANSLFEDKSYKKAASFYKKAAKKGHAEAQLKLGDILKGKYSYVSKTYEQYEDVKINLKKSFMWIHKSAEQGHAPAQYELGNIFRGRYNSETNLYEQYGNVKINSEKSFMWLRKSAEQGYTSGQIRLGDLFYLGYLKDYSQAAEWYRKAADKSEGALSVMYRLSEIYSEGGFGVKQDCAQARSWYDKIVKLVTDTKTYRYHRYLGLVAQNYLSGKNPCIKKDYKKAIDVYFSVAKNENYEYEAHRAVSNLIEMYTNGRGVKKNISMVYALRLASLQIARYISKKKAVEADLKAEELGLKLTQKQLIEAIKIYRKWEKEWKSLQR